MVNNDITINEVMDNLIKDCNTYHENLNRLNEDGVQELNEGLWEKIKYGLSKLGRYKAGGKIFGKGKVDKEWVQKVKVIIDKKGNEVIKTLDAKIKETNPKFPNNEKEEDFLKTVMEIAAVYDSIVGSTQKNVDEKGYLPIDIANGVIEDLAIYVKKFLDVDLAAVYTTMDEAKKAPAPPLQAKDVRTQLQGKVGTDSIKRDSQQMATLKSNKLPLVLAGVGTALGALGWLAQTQWLQDLIMRIFDAGSPAEDAVIQTINGGAPDAEGFVHWASQIQGTPIQTGADVQGFIDKFGIENVQQMFMQNGGGTVEEQGQKLLQLIGGENAGKPVGELFNEKTFGDMKLGRNLFGISTAGKFVARVVIKQAVKAVAGAGAGIAASVAGIGSVLVPLGIGLIATGALVKLLRVKGQKQSRAKTLNDLFQSLQPVKATGKNVPVVDDLDGGSGQKIGGDITKQKTGDVSGKMSTDDLHKNVGKFLKYLNGLELPTPTPVKPVKQKKQPEDLYNPRYVDKSPEGFSHDQSTWDESVNLNEGYYIKDKQTIELLNKQLGGTDAIKKFEGFIYRLAILRNIIKKTSVTGNKQIDSKIDRIKNNPIMKINFGLILNVPANDKKAVKQLKDFIFELLKIIDNSKMQYSNILNKINEVATAVGSTKIAPDIASIKETFKQNLTPLIADIVSIFQILSKINKQKAKPVNEVLNEQVEKMKHLVKFRL
jgi:predicted phage tail protein